MSDNDQPLLKGKTNSSTSPAPLPTTEDEFYEAGDVILEQGHVLDKIIQIADDQDKCVLMTRRWSDGTEEEIGYLSGGDYIGLLFYSGFEKIADDSLVTYTCVKNVHCYIVNCSNCTQVTQYLCKQDDKSCAQSIYEHLKIEMFKVVPGFCLLPRNTIYEIINSENNIVTLISREKGDKIITSEGTNTTCYILLDGKVGPEGFRHKEPLEIFGEARFRNKTQTRTGDIEVFSENATCLEIDIVKLENLKIISGAYGIISDALRYRGNMMDFQKVSRTNLLNYKNLAKYSEIDPKPST
jgi:hypothetical protein